MTSSKSSFAYLPFEKMKALLEARAVSLPESNPPRKSKENPAQDPETDQKFFTEAMEDVIPISRDNYIERGCPVLPSADSREGEDAETLLKLRNLIQSGEGFNVSDTPEYIEGTGYHIHREIARRLHRGDYSIQAHVDLHGLTAEAAKAVFEDFLKWASTNGKQGILIIHGRGLSSPAEPVLKKKVVEWLTRGPWRKWVIAFASARRCDGGAGATYVLLRDRPVSKRLKLRGRSSRPHLKTER